MGNNDDFRQMQIPDSITNKDRWSVSISIKTPPKILIKIDRMLDYDKFTSHYTETGQKKILLITG